MKQPPPLGGGAGLYVQKPRLYDHGICPHAAAMIPVTSLAQVPACSELTVIINCGTRLVTTLALIAAVEHARSPVLLIDCESRDGSRDHFGKLARKHELKFHWLEWPLRVHGVALDHLFSGVAADTVLLLDSDLELRSVQVVETMRAALGTASDAYGSGFLHGPHWLGKAHEMDDYAGYYAERMWIPCVLLRVPEVRRAIESGDSFRARRTFHDFSQFPRLSRCTALRHKIPLLRKQALWRPRRSPDMKLALAPTDVGPSFMEYDTGADLHRWQREHGKRLVSLPDDLWAQVRHYHGITRAAVANPLVRLISRLRRDRDVIFTRQVDVESEIRSRLADVYGIVTD